MRFTTGFLRSCALLAAGCWEAALCQTPADAQLKKRAATQIVDSIVADAIGKLPDTNTAEALQRVPGVQINTDLGEGSTVVVRGLGQVETLLNGRETFSA